MEQNSIPENILTPGYDDYDEFLVERRKLMAKKIKEYYYSCEPSLVLKSSDKLIHHENSKRKILSYLVQGSL